MKKINFSVFRIFIFLILVFCFSFISCDNNSIDKVELDCGWKYSLTNPDIYDSELEPLSDSQLNNLENLLPSKIGNIYLTKQFLLPTKLQKQDIACYLGRISYSDRTYINHYLIGSTGYDENLKYSSGYEPRFYELPEELLLAGINTITIEIYVQNRGYLKSNAFISFHDKAKNAWLSERFWNCQIYLIFAFMLFFLTIYSLWIFFKINSKKDILFYSIMCFLTIFFLSIFYIKEIPFLRFYKSNYSLFEKVNSCLIPSIIFFVFTLFFDDFFSRKTLVIQKLIIAGILIFPQLIYLLIPVSSSNGFFRLIPFFGFVPGFLYIIYLFFLELKQSKIYSFKLSLCVLIIPLFAIFDLFFHQGLKLNFLPYIFFMGLPISLFAIAFLISKKNITELKQEISKNLLPLENSNLKNDVLPTQQILPKFQTYKIAQNNSLKNYDVAYFINYDAQIVYDLFIENNELNGLALFFIDGNLETAKQILELTKKIVRAEFTNEKKIPLVKIMQNINSKIFNEKQKNDNLISGILIRIFDSRIEYVNIGHSPAFFRNKNATICKAIQIDSESYNLQSEKSLGVTNFEMNYKGIGFSVKEGDAVILYSKAFENAKNLQGESFGKSRIRQAFRQSTENSAQEKLRYILNMFQNYTHDVPVEQNLALLIFEKTQNSF